MRRGPLRALFRFPDVLVLFVCVFQVLILARMMILVSMR